MFRTDLWSSISNGWSQVTSAAQEFVEEAREQTRIGQGFSQAVEEAQNLVETAKDRIIQRLNPQDIGIPLPQELLSHCLTLSGPCAIRAAANVNRTWRQLILQDPDLRKTLEIAWEVIYGYSGVCERPQLLPPFDPKVFVHSWASGTTQEPVDFKFPSIVYEGTETWDTKAILLRRSLLTPLFDAGDVEQLSEFIYMMEPLPFAIACIKTITQAYLDQKNHFCALKMAVAYPEEMSQFGSAIKDAFTLCLQEGRISFVASAVRYVQQRYGSCTGAAVLESFIGKKAFDNDLKTVSQIMEAYPELDYQSLLRKVCIGLLKNITCYTCYGALTDKGDEHFKTIQAISSTFPYFFFPSIDDRFLKTEWSKKLEEDLLPGLLHEGKITEVEWILSNWFGCTDLGGITEKNGIRRAIFRVLFAQMRHLWSDAPSTPDSK